MDDNINLVRKIVWSFHHSSGLEWDDLFQEAAIAYYEALKTYDNSRGKITTHAWHCITNRLKNYLKEQEEYKSRKYEGELCSLEDVILTRHPAQTASDFWESLTEDTKEIANIVLTTPKKFVCLPYDKVEERIFHLMERRGWPTERTQRSLQDLRLACL